MFHINQLMNGDGTLSKLVANHLAAEQATLVLSNRAPIVTRNLLWV